MDKIDAYLAVIIASLLPVFVAIISFFLRIDKLHFLSVIGIIVGFLGCSIILAPKITVNLNFYGLSLCLIAVIALSMATLIIKDGFSYRATPTFCFHSNDSRRIAITSTFFFI